MFEKTKEKEITNILSKLNIGTLSQPIEQEKENFISLTQLPNKSTLFNEFTTLKDIKKITEESLISMKEKMRASRFKILNDFIINYYLSQGDLKFIPKEWKKHYLRLILRAIIKYAMCYEIEEKNIFTEITNYILLHGLPADCKEIEQFILINSSN